MLIEPTDVQPAWILLRTKPSQERMAVEHLASRGVDVYCPRVLEPRRHRRSPRGAVPLFPSYVFALAAIGRDFSRVRYCPGIAGLVRFGPLVAAVDDAAVAFLKEREAGRGFLEFGQVRTTVAPGAHVRIVNGPLAGLRGIVTRYAPASDRVQLLLEAVSSSRRVEVPASMVCNA